MAENSYPFDGGTAVGEAQWITMARQAILLDGVNLIGGNGLPYGDSSGRQVKVPVMVGHAGGHYYENTAIKTISIAANATGSPRWDLVVLRANRTVNTVTAEVVTGSLPSTLPTPTQNSTTWEVPLAKVVVANGAATITASDVTDLRVIAAGIDGGNGSQMKLFESILASPATTIDAQNLPQTLRDLIIVVEAQSTNAVNSQACGIRFNNDTSSSYDTQEMWAVDTTFTAGRNSLSHAPFGDVVGGSGNTQQWAGGDMRVYGYASGHRKPWLAQWSGYYNTTPFVYRDLFGGTWRQGAPVNRVTLLLPNTAGNLAAESRLTIYGVR